MHKTAGNPRLLQKCALICKHFFRSSHITRKITQLQFSLQKTYFFLAQFDLQNFSAARPSPPETFLRGPSRPAKIFSGPAQPFPQNVPEARPAKFFSSPAPNFPGGQFARLGALLTRLTSLVCTEYCF